LIADHDNGCVRTVDAQGQIDPLIGMCGERGFSGDGGQATEATLDGPVGVVFDADGRIYVSDEQNGVIRRVNADGSIETVAGEGSIPAATAPDGTKAADLLLNHPSYLAIDADGRIYFSDFLDSVVMRIERSGRVTRIAGTGEAAFSGDGGPAIEAELDWPTGLALDGNGNLFISDANNHRIRMVDVEGTITTFIGTGEGGYSGDGGPAVEAQVQAPSGLAFDPAGRLVIADQGNDLVRIVDDAGVITTIAGVVPYEPRPGDRRSTRRTTGGRRPASFARRAGAGSPARGRRPSGRTSRVASVWYRGRGRSRSTAARDRR
jgi:trimeric autotransporter adhesin